MRRASHFSQNYVDVYEALTSKATRKSKASLAVTLVNICDEVVENDDSIMHEQYGPKRER